MRFIKTELVKLKRSSILLLGLIILVCAPLLSILQQQSMNTPVGDYGFQNLMNATIWYNMGLFMPITITLIGGYMVNREYVDDTLKNIMVIPVSYQKMVYRKLTTLAFITILLSIYSFLVTVFLSIVFFPIGLSAKNMICGFFQMSGMGICIYISVLPIVCWCSGKKNRFFAGTVVAFLYGFFSIPIAGYNQQDYYPVSAGLSIIHYEGDTGSNSITNQTGIALIVLIIVLILSFVIVAIENKRWCIDGK